MYIYLYLFLLHYLFISLLIFHQWILAVLVLWSSGQKKKWMAANLQHIFTFTFTSYQVLRSTNTYYVSPIDDMESNFSARANTATWLITASFYEIQLPSLQPQIPHSHVSDFLDVSSSA